MVYDTRRKSTGRSSKRPSGSLYVGYVEDDESVASIMKKFEELDRFSEEVRLKKQAAALDLPPADAPVEPPRKDKGKGKYVEMPDPETTLDDAQLEELFKRTSAFTVRSISDYGRSYNLLERELALDDVDEDTLMMLLDDMDDSSDDDYCEEYYGEADEDFFDAEFGDGGRRKRRRSGQKTARVPKEKRARYDRDAILQKYRNLHLQDAEGRQIIVKKKVRQTDPRLPAYTRIPPAPLPRSWASTIVSVATLKQRPANPPGSKYVEAPIVGCDLEAACGRGFQVLLMDPPIPLPGEERLPGMIDVEDLSKLAITDALIPSGFVFIWIDKVYFPHIVRIMQGWGFGYVENICWVRLLPNNKHAHEGADYLRRSKLSCLIFRKNGGADEEGKTIELRHQRNPDVVFDFIKPRASPLDADGLFQPEEKPAFVREAIETLLPEAVYKAVSDGQPERPGRMLELWGQRGRRFEGWTSLVNVRAEGASSS